METFSIKISGDINPYADRNKVIASFARLAKIDEAKAQQVLDSAPVVIKKGLDSSMAAKFKEALQHIGIPAEMVSEQAPSLAVEPTTAESAPKPLSSEATDIAEPTHQAPDDEPQPGWSFAIDGRPDYAFLTVQIPAHETLKVEASSMATMDTNLKMKTKLRGGFSRFLSGESLFINEFTAQGGPGEIGIAPGSPGDMTHIYLDGNTIYLQNSAFVAATMDVQVETKWQGLTKGFFSGESLFLIRASGQGDLWFNTYGALIEIDVTGDYVVDTGNIVAFTEGLDYTITKVGGYKSLFFSGEGFVCRFSGQGKVWIQTRGVQAFAWWAHLYRPVEKSSG